MTASPPYDTISTTSQRTDSLLTKCCFCIPLRIGCFILGYLNLLSNALHTLVLVTIVTYVGVATHGFDHVDEPSSDEDVPVGVGNVTKPFLAQVGLFLILLLLANVTWLGINIACLVGLHKRQPGPIRVYIGFATTRFILCLVAFVFMVVHEGTDAQTVVTQGMNLVLAAYFILVYYVYASRLEKEQMETPHQFQNNMSDVILSYPTKLDKQNLVVA